MRPGLRHLDSLEDHAQHAAPPLQGLQGIGAQIHRHLVQMRGIPDDRGVSGLEPALETYPGRQGGTEELECLLDDRLDVHWYALTETAATEAQDTIDERFGAPRCMHYVVEIASQRRVWRRTLVRKLPVAEDRTEDVVEVVGDATGEGADRFHLLRLPKLRLQLILVDLRLLLRRDVDGGSDESGRLALPVAQTAAAGVQPAPLAAV